MDPATDARPAAGVGGRDEGVDRGRPVYLDDCRIDIVRRLGTPPLASNASLARAVARAVEAAEAPSPASVTLVLTDDAELEELSSAHLGKPEPTDVLSFPMLPPDAFPPHPGKASPEGQASPAAKAATAAKPRTDSPDIGDAASREARVHLGDIAISVERAIRQAEEGRGGQTGDIRWSPVDEMQLLATHGTLHLCGWDHAEPEEEAAMRSLEQRLLAEERR